MKEARKAFGADEKIGHDLTRSQKAAWGCDLKRGDGLTWRRPPAKIFLSRCASILNQLGHA